MRKAEVREVVRVKGFIYYWRVRTRPVSQTPLASGLVEGMAGRMQFEEQRTTAARRDARLRSFVSTFSLTVVVRPSVDDPLPSTVRVVGRGRYRDRVRCSVDRCRLRAADDRYRLRAAAIELLRSALCRYRRNSDTTQHQGENYDRKEASEVRAHSVFLPVVEMS
jgi:hypothetical protein